MWWSKKLTCNQLIIDRRNLQSTTNEELVEIIKGKRYHPETFACLINEFNKRLMKRDG